MGSPLERFSELLDQDEARIDLAQACLLIAEDVYPALDIAAYQARLEQMAEALRARLPNEHGAEEKILALNRYLFAEQGFAGNVEDYYDPRNSYLNEVLDRKTGIPITLAIVYMVLGRRIGLPLQGVSFPGHFLVRLRLRGGVLVLDPFSGGEPQSEEDLRDRLGRVIPPEAAVGIAPRELPLDQFLEPAGTRQILARMLRNLKAIYERDQRDERLLEVLDRSLVLEPRARGDLRDRGLAYTRLECWRAALQDLTEYLELAPDADDGEEIRARVLELRQRCARLN